MKKITFLLLMLGGCGAAPATAPMPVGGPVNPPMDGAMNHPPNPPGSPPVSPPMSEPPSTSEPARKPVIKGTLYKVEKHFKNIAGCDLKGKEVTDPPFIAVEKNNGLVGPTTNLTSCATENDCSGRDIGIFLDEEPEVPTYMSSVGDNICTLMRIDKKLKLAGNTLALEITESQIVNLSANDCQDSDKMGAIFNKYAKMATCTAKETITASKVK